MRRVLGWMVAGLCAAVVSEAAFVPVPLGDGANASLMDEVAEDQKGGFIDQGPNDLHLLPSGLQTINGIPFKLGSSHSTDEKACIVLGGPKRPYLGRKATVSLAHPARGDFLYLFHGVTMVSATEKDKNPIIGTVVLTYKSGKALQKHVRLGRDVGDWTSPKSYRNAVRSWTIYNKVSQVSLFLTGIPIEQGQEVASVSLEEGAGTWIVAGMTIGDKRILRPILPDLTLERKFDAPPKFNQPLPVYPAGSRPKNVILVLGDGMGQGALDLADLYLRKDQKSDGLVINQMPFSGYCTTFSATADVTDSAASGTAFATGHKSYNTAVALDLEKKPLDSIATIAHKAGLSVGIMTDDPLFGATPAVFYAHAATRGDTAKIMLDALQSDFEILLGYASKNWLLPKEQGGWRKDGKELLSGMLARGFTLVEDVDAFLQAPKDKRVIGLMKDQSMAAEACYGPLATTAIERLSQNQKGFFLMFESCDPDHGNHANSPEKSIYGTVKADWAAWAAISYSLAHDGDTLVLVTADHETGGVRAIRSPGTGKVTPFFEATSHTSAPVATHAFGRGAERFEGRIDNTDIPRIFAECLGLELAR